MPAGFAGGGSFRAGGRGDRRGENVGGGFPGHRSWFTLVFLKCGETVAQFVHGIAVAAGGGIGRDGQEVGDLLEGLILVDLEMDDFALFGRKGGEGGFDGAALVVEFQGGSDGFEHGGGIFGIHGGQARRLQETVTFVAHGDAKVIGRRLKFGDTRSEGGEFGKGLLDGLFGEGVAGTNNQGVAVEGCGVTVVGGGKASACRGLGAGVLVRVQRNLVMDIVIDPGRSGFV